MCGIVGFTHRNGPAPEGVLRAAITSIHHRGPDQNGVYESATVSLGAVRLKILDLSGGDQPITDAASGTTIVFNGEVYNFRELRAELESLSHRFESHCDTEVVLRAFLQWDTACFPRLRGMFALAIWQETAQRLVLARDRMGIKPLYLHERGGEIHFASELKALFAHPVVPRTLDPDALNLFTRYNYIPTHRTLAQGITKLRPGTFLEWRDGTYRTEAYWELRFQPRIVSDAHEQLDHLLRESIREHLVSDVPLGVWLSGGLDSSTITHYAAELFPGKLKTFSVSFSGRSFDESPYFRTVAQHYGTDHEEFDLHPERDDLPSIIERLVHFSDEPSADAGALPVWYLSQMCRRHVTVALSGEGADELFGGYITYLADRYANFARRMRAPLTPAFLFAKLLPVSDDKVSFEYKVKRFFEGASLPPLEAHLYWNGAFPTRHVLAPLPNDWPLDGSTRDFLHLDQVAYLPDDILNKCDRMSMAHSLEVRPAFLDHRIVEFAASLPHNLKMRGTKLKRILRELMRDKLPPAVTSRAKQGFDIPTHHWFRTILRPMLRDHVNETAVTAAGLSWGAIQQLLDEHDGRKANHGYSLWGLLMLTLWMKEWKITR